MKKMSKATGIAIFTVLALGSIFIADYSKSGAKYYKDVETGLTYNMGLSQLSKKELGTFIPRKDKSETDMLYVEYSVPRNLIMTDEDTTDTYTIVVDNGCEIKTVNGTKATSVSNSYTFTYNDSNADDIIVAYTCPVNKIEISSTSDFMQSKISIYEQMDTDVRRFLYTKNDGLFKKSDVLPKPIVSDYHQLVILETDDAATINTKINEWIENNKKEYDKNYSSYVWINNGLSTETMKTYLKKAYTSDIKNFDSTAIRGVDFTHEGDTYTYEMTEEFLSYALTDAVYDNTKKERYFYFADTTVDDTI
ncbi:MAG: hypothetical protein K2L98_04800, partial [Bacilli bacterium]|nr:hypothetical protein [Bacilli bacterium]